MCDMNLKNKVKYVVLVVIMLILCVCNSANAEVSVPEIADVGSFESYDSGSDWGGSSSWDSGSDWGGSSSWDDDDYGSSYSSGGGVYLIGNDFGTFLFGVVIIIIVYVVYYYYKKNSSHGNMQPRPRPDSSGMSEAQVEAKVKAIDPVFNKEEFLSFARSVFVKLQEAWTARDWSVIRTFESNELFEQHQNQLQRFIDNNQINKMEQICVKSVSLYSFEQTGDKEVLKVTLSSKMIDYIVDATTDKILKGDRTTIRHSTYRLTFIRKAGVKTKAGTSDVNTTNCPNCGAPTQITSSGKCEYCGSVITTGEYNWVLSDLTKVY